MNIAINGFGRIGRNTLRNIFLRRLQHEIKVVAINDITDTATLAHLLKYDSVHGPFPFVVRHDEDHLYIEEQTINIYKEKDPSLLPWAALDIDIAIESTGLFTSRDKATLHLDAGAKQTIISAPSPDKDVPTVVLGINDSSFDWRTPLFSNASCTTNNVAPLVKILDENWGINDGYITTVHSMTG